MPEIHLLNLYDFFPNVKLSIHPALAPHASSVSTHVFEVLEGDELDDVAEDGLALRWAQDPVVPVQYLHVGEICVAHADDDDRHGQVGRVHNGLPRVGHVGDDAVRQDQQDEVFLVGRGSHVYWLLCFKSGFFSEANLNKACSNPPESLREVGRSSNI